MLWLLLCCIQAQAQTALSEKTFQQPPRQYGIRCWWWWLNGNVTKDAITRDLEEMKAKGFSGACIFDAGGQNQRGNGDVPEGPLWGSEAWRALYLHAINEADRLGLVMSLSIQSGWNLGGPDITPEEAAKQIVFSEITLQGGKSVHQLLPQPKAHDDFYRDIVVLAIPTHTVTNRPPIRDLPDKAATREVGWSVPETRHLLTDVAASAHEEDATLAEVINLNKYVNEGMLDWNAPAGNWTVIRFGYSTTSAEVSTSSGQWKGRVIDYTSEKHFNRYWDTHVEPLLQLIGNKAGKTLRYLQTDSFEAGGMNWSDGFEQEFRQRRGYDPIPYLPILAGKIIENRDVSNRFLSDLRKTLSDCISDNHYRVFAQRAKRFGMGIQPESAGPHAGPFDGLKNYSHSEIMMSEFWSPSPHRSKPIDRFFVKQAASAAKIFNKKLVGAESFTTIGPHWNDVIWADMKPSADHEFCAGLNLVYLHTFTCSPPEMGLPGQEYFAGTHFNPNVTWWNYSSGFINYLTRVQYLMQQGTTQADVLYYYGDHIPNLGRYKEDDPAKALPDFDYDLTNEDQLLKLQANKGRLWLPHGVSYRVLVLPEHQVLSLAALQKVEQLLRAGATIIGPKTLTTASLVGYPATDQAVKRITTQLWGENPSATGEHQVGAGRLIWGKTTREVLLSQGLLPDCEWINKSQDLKFDYVHRQASGVDYYFISNQNRQAVQQTLAFRITGKQPELWNAVTGETLPAERFYQQNGRTYVELSLDPYGSVFVVFRQSTIPQAKANKPLVQVQTVGTLTNPWQVHFDPRWGGPASVQFDKLISWTDRPEEGIKYYSGKAVYQTTFDASTTTGTLWLDLGEVKDVGIARVRLNGADLGLVWTPPFRVPISGKVLSKDNQLEIEVVNTWRNRLVGDRDKPQNQRFTQTNITIKKEWELLPSGLLGPVTILQKQ